MSKGLFDHPYPTTKIIWAPAKAATQDDLLATTGDYLRLWSVSDNGIHLKCLLNNVCHLSTLLRNPELSLFHMFLFACFLPSLLALLVQNKNSEFCAPLTSFDWNDIDPSIIGTSSIDTTCTIWNIEVRMECDSEW